MSLLCAAIRQISDNKHKQVAYSLLTLRKLRHVVPLALLSVGIVI